MYRRIKSVMYRRIKIVCPFVKYPFSEVPFTLEKSLAQWPSGPLTGYTPKGLYTEWAYLRDNRICAIICSADDIFPLSLLCIRDGPLTPLTLSLHYLYLV